MLAMASWGRRCWQWDEGGRIAAPSVAAEGDCSLTSPASAGRGAMLGLRWQLSREHWFHGQRSFSLLKGIMQKQTLHPVPQSQFKRR